MEKDEIEKKRELAAKKKQQQLKEIDSKIYVDEEKANTDAVHYQQIKANEVKLQSDKNAVDVDQYQKQEANKK